MSHCKFSDLIMSNSVSKLIEMTFKKYKINLKFHLKRFAFSLKNSYWECIFSLQGQSDEGSRMSEFDFLVKHCTEEGRKHLNDLICLNLRY